MHSFVHLRAFIYVYVCVCMHSFVHLRAFIYAHVHVNECMFLYSYVQKDQSGQKAPAPPFSLHILNTPNTNTYVYK